MKRALNCLAVLVFIGGCGSSSPTESVTSAVLVDEQSTIEADRFRITAFEVSEFMIDAALLITVGSTLPISVVVLDDANFALWEAGSPSSAIFDSGPATNVSIEVTLSQLGVYHFILSNRGSDTAAVANVLGELFWITLQ